MSVDVTVSSLPYCPCVVGPPVDKTASAGTLAYIRTLVQFLSFNFKWTNFNPAVYYSIKVMELLLSRMRLQPTGT